jgi:hypothetical protein
MYIKPSSTFKLSKCTKRMMATIVDPVQRNQFKKMMIQAELFASIAVKREPKKSGPRTQLDALQN